MSIEATSAKRTCATAIVKKFAWNATHLLLVLVDDSFLFNWIKDDGVGWNDIERLIATYRAKPQVLLVLLTFSSPTTNAAETKCMVAAFQHSKAFSSPFDIFKTDSTLTELWVQRLMSLMPLLTQVRFPIWLTKIWQQTQRSNFTPLFIQLCIVPWTSWGNGTNWTSTRANWTQWARAWATWAWANRANAVSVFGLVRKPRACITEARTHDVDPWPWWAWWAWWPKIHSRPWTDRAWARSRSNGPYRPRAWVGARLWWLRWRHHMRVAATITKSTSPLEKMFANGVCWPGSTLPICFHLHLRLVAAILTILTILPIPMPCITSITEGAPALGKEFAKLGHSWLSGNDPAAGRAAPCRPWQLQP